MAGFLHLDMAVKAHGRLVVVVVAVVVEVVVVVVVVFICFVQNFDIVSQDYLMLVIEILRHLTTFPEPQVFNLNLCLVFYL